MIEHETALDLFQRLTSQDDTKQQLLIDRLNRCHQLLFPTYAQKHACLTEVLDQNRTMTKTFLHDFIFNSIEYMNYRNELLQLPFKSEEINFNSPQANKDSLRSEKPPLQMKLDYDESIIFLYIDTEYKECPFISDYVQWYDCQTSTDLISTLLRLEQSCFISNPTQRFVLIIDSSTQVPINDYFISTTPSHVMPIEENKLLTIQWHTILCHLIPKYKLSCVLVEHLDIDTPMFDRLIGKRDERSIRRNSKNKDTQIPFSEFAFGRLMNSEHYINNQFDYRQIRASDMLNFQYDLNQSTHAMSLLDLEQ
ncbi:unnamed protein product [Adineta ricciae]|uniref:Uncharacterized protein n=1 Tax=Adineta ricciae TaxID=249248 RepID=A0A813YCE5_ADIRI|nr:unnamed protein product [Adineta ricciae]CAF0890855.1 unnamed protein product [Adineta ricciae]